MRTEFLKRSACQIAAQLPEDRREALLVINYAREIVCNLGAAWEVPSAMPDARDGPSVLKLVSRDRRLDQG